jgi:hypothetical protein
MKRVIQLLQKINDNDIDHTFHAYGFLGTTHKRFKIGKEYILTFKRGTNKQYTKEFYIVRCKDIFPLQYTFELLNDGN